ncbi:MAG TPA: glycosyltransferase, partial [Solirubrobacteraceae bacterium]|nr:glycosyltransferase [Solirubrobacteraceae bacterium]
MARVLAVTNLYPPHHLGGYEVIQRGAMAGLRAGGHAVRVLASHTTFPARGPETEPDVHRDLRWYWHDHAFPALSPRERWQLERDNAASFARHLGEHRPDVLFWWAMGGMSLGLIEQGRRAGVPALGYVADDWPAYGPRTDGWLRLWRHAPRLVARAVEQASGLPARFELAGVRWVFISEFQRRRSGSPPGSLVAYPGVDPARFPPAPPRPAWRGALACVGRIDPRKGIDVAMDALHELPHATLTVSGGGDEAHLAALRTRPGAARTRFAGHGDPAAAYAAADAVLFPVTWDEPFGLVPLEAMSVGRPEVATGTGGSAEYLRDGENCLLVPPGDARALAGAVRRLA